MKKAKQILAGVALLTVLVSSLAVAPIHAAASSDRNLLSNEDGSANAGLYGNWLTKYTFAASDVSTATVDLTAEAFTPHEREWSLEKPGKAADGVVNAPSLNEAFLVEPADVSGKSPVGVLIDLQKNCSVSSLKVYMAYTVGGLRRVIGSVYTGTTLDSLSKVKDFNNYNNGDANPPVNADLAGTARYVFVAFTSYNALATVSGRATGLPLDEIQVYGSVPRYTVNFDANGGSSAETSRSVESGSVLGTLPTATLSGKDFAGWAKEDGTIVTADTVVTGAMTLKAVWSRNLLCNEDGSVNAGLYGNWLTKYTFAAADVSATTVDLTAAAFTAHERDWDLEKPGKAVDGVVNAPSLNEAFLVEPADVSGKFPVGVLIDLQQTCNVSLVKVYMAYTVGGLRRVIGRVYAGTTPETLSLVSDFNSWDGKDVNPPVNVALTGTARYVFVAFTSYNALATVSGRATGLPLDEIQVLGSLPSYTVSFDTNGGSVVGSKAVVSGSALDLTAVGTDKADAYFTGWYTDDACTVPFVTGTAVTADLELHAGWQTVNKALCIEGVQVRLTGTEGMRFIANADAAAVEAIKTIDANAVFGILLQQQSQVADDLVYGVCSGSLSGGAKVDVVSKNWVTDENTLRYAAVITGMPQAVYGMNIASRTYIHYTDASGVARTYYSSEDSSTYYATCLKAAAQATLALGGLSADNMARLNDIINAE